MRPSLVGYFSALVPSLFYSAPSSRIFFWIFFLATGPKRPDGCADTSFELAPLLSQIGGIVAPTSWYFGAKQLRSVLFYLNLHMFAYHYGETNVQAFCCNLFFSFYSLPFHPGPKRSVVASQNPSSNLLFHPPGKCPFLRRAASWDNRHPPAQRTHWTIGFSASLGREKKKATVDDCNHTIQAVNR